MKEKRDTIVARKCKDSMAVLAIANHCAATIANGRLSFNVEKGAGAVNGDGEKINCFLE